MEKVIQAEKETVDSQHLLPNYIAGPDTGRSIPSRSVETVPIAWEETSTVLFRSHASGDGFSF